LLVNHPEVPQNRGEAVKLLEEAAAGGSWRSSVVLGILYRDGKYVPKDPLISYRWYTIAENQGGKEADAVIRHEISAIRKSLSAEQQKLSEDAAAKWVSTYSRANLFVFDGGNSSPFFPVAEVYSTELAQANSSKGADVR